MKSIRLLLILICPLIVAFSTYRVFSVFFLEPIEAADTQLVLFEIPPRVTFRTISSSLADSGLLRFSRALDLLARVKKSDKTINAGEYELSRSMNPLQILEKLRSGQVLVRQVLVKEGASIRELGAEIERAGLVSKAEFDKAVRDPEILAKAGFQYDSFEGYLLPDTYNFSRPTSAQKIIRRMVDEFEKNWPEQYSKRAAELNMSRHDIVILASMIEKESGSFEEQPMISSVFYNRIKKRMPFQSDPTVIYGIANFNGDLTREDLRTPSLYNTYTIPGLPAGPICNPGKTAILAALHPAESGYLYFVANGSGGHIFSATLDAHNNAVNRYQRGRAQAAAELDSSAARN